MVPLSPDFAGQFEGLHHLLLLLLHLLQSSSPLKPDLHVVAEQLQDLLIRHLEALVFVSFLVDLGFTLDHDTGLLILV
jgi:hypothetical protein